MRAQLSLEMLVSLAISICIALVLVSAYVGLQNYSARAYSALSSDANVILRSASVAASAAGCHA